MPRLDWIGRKAVENRHRQVPFHLLKEVPKLSVGDPGSGNLLVEGDNLLLYNGILKGKTPDGGNVLTTALLSHLPKHDGPKVIYGTACRIGPERLRRENVTIKQLPYKIRVM